ncbi:MAG TPA: DUF3175 domain-containing protein [Steroidobacteraceae bacterium]|nr:DUF3175 domain-containing protein [Steroidobacteraceae bacterium]
MAARKPSKAPVRRRSTSKGVKAKRWSSRVTKTSNALDLESGVFKLKSPRALARSLKKSSERSSRRKSTPFRSAMSMLNFEINRGGRNLSPEQTRVLNAAKLELRKLFGRPTTAK